MMMKEEEEQKQQRNAGWMNQEMIHHHHDRVRPSPMRPGTEAVRQHNFDTLSISELVRGVRGIERKE